MHKNHNNFVQAIAEKKKIRLVFLDNDKHIQAKTVVPLDYSPGLRETDKSDVYQFWDFDIGANGTPLILLPGQIEEMELDAESFNPDDFVDAFNDGHTHWRRFFIKRNWGLK